MAEARFKKPGFLSEKLKILTSSIIHRVQHFSWNFAHVCFLLTTAYKSVFEIFYILFRSWVICKNQKGPGFSTLVFCIFINNSRSKQNKKIPFCRHCEVVLNFTKNIKLSGSWSFWFNHVGPLKEEKCPAWIANKCLRCFRLLSRVSYFVW